MTDAETVDAQYSCKTGRSKSAIGGQRKKGKVFLPPPLNVAQAIRIMKLCSRSKAPGGTRRVWRSPASPSVTKREKSVSLQNAF